MRETLTKIIQYMPAGILVYDFEGKQKFIENEEFMQTFNPGDEALEDVLTEIMLNEDEAERHDS